ncbi:MAG: OmpH family outer membrane protein [Phycisphaeraceae bacterium]|nr:OmpH family outer membrane protein [Phycisphaeraceae bacterium]MCW5753823.1 OmpH family outer membrane protein [Phycisphaeraceae bacterium]
MRQRRIAACVAIGCALVGAAALAGWGMVHTKQAQPVAVALVDLDRLFNQLDEFRKIQSNMSAQRDSARASIDRLTRDIERIDDELKTANRSADEQRQLRAERFVKTRTREIEVEVRQAQIEYDFGTALTEVYERANRAIAEIAREQGYALVMLDDRETKIPPPTNTAAVMAAITSRKVLFAVDSVDITGLVATRMNNNYAAGK